MTGRDSLARDIWRNRQNLNGFYKSLRQILRTVKNKCVRVDNDVIKVFVADVDFLIEHFEKQ